MKKTWKHPKYKGREFQGSYVKTASDQRYFKLTPIGVSIKTHEFDSWNAAVAAGWRLK